MNHFYKILLYYGDAVGSKTIGMIWGEEVLGRLGIYF